VSSRPGQLSEGLIRIEIEDRMAYHRCHAKAVSRDEYSGLVARGEQEPFAVPVEGMNPTFFSSDPLRVTEDERKYSMASRPGEWYDLAIECGLVPKLCGFFPNRVHLGYIDGAARKYFKDQRARIQLAQEWNAETE
jgi:hypothetical protein